MRILKDLGHRRYGLTPKQKRLLGEALFSTRVSIPVGTDSSINLYLLENQWFAATAWGAEGGQEIEVVRPRERKRI